MQGAASGHYFENYVVIELLKNFSYSADKANLTYYRDSNAKEIDVIVEENGLVHPLEIKKSANPNRREVKKYEVLDKTALERGSGGIVCMCEEVILVSYTHLRRPPWNTVPPEHSPDRRGRFSRPL